MCMWSSWSLPQEGSIQKHHWLRMSCHILLVNIYSNIFLECSSRRRRRRRRLSWVWVEAKHWNREKTPSWTCEYSAAARTAMTAAVQTETFPKQTNRQTLNRQTDKQTNRHNLLILSRHIPWHDRDCWSIWIWCLVKVNLRCFHSYFPHQGLTCW